MKIHIYNLKFIRLIALIIAGMFVSATLKPTEVKAQLEEKTIRSESKQLFFVDPMVFYSKEKSRARLDVYMEIPLENLQFKKNYNSKKYDANVSYTVAIKNFAGEVVENESMTDYVTTTKEEQKGLEGSAKYIVREYYLNPGKYDMEVTLVDMNTKKELTLRNKIDVVDFINERISFSNIMLISNMATENGKRVITPLVNGNVDNLKEFYVFLRYIMQRVKTL
ncbi:MAG: hypothetical protein IPG02_02115 [Ignavibacteria bacterium]|nr:hypothetical protein [Ignavibacteria bacterium]